MTVEATLPGPEQPDSATIETGRQMNWRDNFEAVGLLLGVLVILLVVALLIGIAPPGGLT